MNSSVITSILEPGLFALFLAFVVVFIYFGITLTHHWNYYSFNVQIKRIMKGLYFFVSTFILLALLFFIGLYIGEYGI
jgi:hypothetical protein